MEKTFNNKRHKLITDGDWWGYERKTYGNLTWLPGSNNAPEAVTTSRPSNPGKDFKIFDPKTWQ